MGKKTRHKQAQAEAQEAAFQASFAQMSVAAKNKAPLPPLLDEVGVYAGVAIRPVADFVRKTKSQDRNRQLLELVRHLFVRYKTPRILERAWRAQDLPDRPDRAPARFGGGRRLNENVNFGLIDFRDWYICVATGQSLYKTRAKAFMSKMEAHLFVNCPYDLALPQALYYATAKAAGATPGLSLRLARSKLSDQPFEAFWKDATRFFALDGNHPSSVQQVNDLVDFISNKHMENAAFRVLGAGHTLGSMLVKLNDWHHSLRRAKILGNSSWEGHALPNQSFMQKIEGREWHWDMVQVTSSSALAAEGTAMRHCVLSYKSRCMSGDISIWSLSLRDPFGTSKRKLTIELRNDGSIVQKRGLANRSPRPDEQHIITRWARDNHLYDNGRG